MHENAMGSRNYPVIIWLPWAGQDLPHHVRVKLDPFNRGLLLVQPELQSDCKPLLAACLTESKRPHETNSSAMEEPVYK